MDNYKQDLQYMIERFCDASDIDAKERLRNQINLMMQASVLEEMAKQGLLGDTNE